MNSSVNESRLVFYTQPTFHIVDYIVCAAFLCVSSGVGIYFSIRGRQTTTEAYFGGRQMKAIPVGISTGVSFLSASSLVGLPSEMFINGYSYIFGAVSGSIGYFLGCMLVSYILYPLGMTSINEYLAKRFKSKVVTYSANVMVLICIFQYMGSCMFGSVIAFNSATGGKVSVVLALVIGGSVGIFYTALGGLKAVVWSDVMQSGVMIIGTFTVIVRSMVDTPGGMPEIIKINRQYERIHQLSWSTDLTIRHTFWGLVFGVFINWGAWCAQPACVQRLCCTRSLRDAYVVSGIAAFLFFIFSMMPCWAGLNIFGYYITRGCDIFSVKWVENNEIILYYVRERLGYPGFQGLFIASLYAGSLSSLSSGLNAASAVLWKDTIKPLLSVEVSDARATMFSKIIVVVFGVLAMFWCYALYSFGGLIAQVNVSITSSMYGAYFALFLTAIFFAHVNYKAVILGLFTSFAFTFWLALGSLLYGPSTTTVLTTTTATCADRNISVAAVTTPPANVSIAAESEKIPTALDGFYGLSYVWFTPFCIIVSILVTLCATGCLGPISKTAVDKNLLCPLLRSQNCKTFRRKRNYSSENGDIKEREILSAELKTMEEAAV